MKQTTSTNEWVFIVRHSDTIHIQVLEMPVRTERKRRWVRVLLRLLRATHKLYRAAA